MVAASPVLRFTGAVCGTSAGLAVAATGSRRSHGTDTTGPCQGRPPKEVLPTRLASQKADGTL